MKTEDIKILEDAAEASNIKLVEGPSRYHHSGLVLLTGEIWNPLEYQDQAMDLLIQHELDLITGDAIFNDFPGPTVFSRKLTGPVSESSEEHDWDRKSAARRAIVRAVAQFNK